MYRNGQYNTKAGSKKYQPQNDGGRFPDESWVVGGDSDVEASVWVANGRNQGEEYLDLRRVKEDGSKLKTFRRSEIRAFYQGLGEHCARLAEQDGLTDEERDIFAQLAEGTVELLDSVSERDAVTRKSIRTRRRRRS